MHHIILSLFHQQKIKQNNLRGVNPVFLKLFSYQNLSPNFQLANDLPIMTAKTFWLNFVIFARKTSWKTIGYSCGCIR
jgi:hypothetical protein